MYLLNLYDGISFLGHGENTFFVKGPTGGARCFCGRFFESDWFYDTIFYRHFNEDHSHLLPNDEIATKFFGGNPFSCLICNFTVDKDDINTQKLHLIGYHDNVLLVLVETLTKETNDNNGKINLDTTFIS